MKIAIACAATIFPKEFGGSEKTVGYRARELDKMGYDVTLLSLGPYKPKKWIHWTGNAEDVDVDEFDVIDNNGPTEFACEHVINTIQGPFYPKRNVVTISDSQGRGMGFKSYRVVHYGTDVDFWEFREEKEDWFVFYSRIVHGKGCHIAVQLAKDMGFHLKVIGEDKKYVEPLYVAQIKKMCQELPNVEYLGPRYEGSEPKNNVWYLQRAKALLFPQFWGEAFGLVMIEALSCGTPVIAGGTNGAPPEVIKHGETGFLCMNYEDYKEAIKNIDQIDPKTCRRDAEERWSAKRMTENYIRLYEAVARGEAW